MTEAELRTGHCHCGRVAFEFRSKFTVVMDNDLALFVAGVGKAFRISAHFCARS